MLIEKRTTQRLVDETTFKIGQRINIKLGYNGVMKNMFDGYITGYNSDSMLEIQCENMAYKLKLKKRRCSRHRSRAPRSMMCWKVNTIF